MPRRSKAVTTSVLSPSTGSMFSDQGTEVATIIEKVMQRIKRHWPSTHIIWRGDSHYGRAEAMTWCEANDCDYIFGFAGNAALEQHVADTAVQLRLRHAFGSDEKLRTWVSFEYQAGSWPKPRRVVPEACGPHDARLKASVRSPIARPANCARRSTSAMS